MKKYLVLILILILFGSMKAQTIHNNVSRDTWVLVYNDTTKQVIAIIDPKYKTTTIYTLKEFTTEEELRLFIKNNNLKEEEQNDTFN